MFFFFHFICNPYHVDFLKTEMIFFSEFITNVSQENWFFEGIKQKLIVLTIIKLWVSYNIKLNTCSEY